MVEIVISVHIPAVVVSTGESECTRIPKRTIVDEITSLLRHIKLVARVKPTCVKVTNVYFQIECYGSRENKTLNAK